MASGMLKPLGRCCSKIAMASSGRPARSSNCASMLSNCSALSAPSLRRRLRRKFNAPSTVPKRSYVSMIFATSSVLNCFFRASASHAASNASSSYSMGLKRNTLSRARWLAPRFISSSQAASACGALPAHSDICAFRSSHSTLCGSAMSAASLTSKAAFKSPAAAKVSQASCNCSELRVLAISAGSAEMAITLRRATPASRGSPAPKASCAKYHQVLSPGCKGCDSFCAACQALRGSPAASRACTPFFKSSVRASAAAVLRRAAKNNSLASGKRPAPSAMVAPRAKSCAVADGRLSNCANSSSCMFLICWVNVG